jgi:hypothetical protein
MQHFQPTVFYFDQSRDHISESALYPGTVAVAVAIENSARPCTTRGPFERGSVPVESTVIIIFRHGI